MNRRKNTITLKDVEYLPFPHLLASIDSSDGRHTKSLYALADVVQRTVTYEIEILIKQTIDEQESIRFETTKYASLNDAIEGFNRIVFPEQGELEFEGWREPIESPGVGIYETDTSKNQ